MKKIMTALCLLFYCHLGIASSHARLPYTPTRYSALIYHGRITENTLGQVIGMCYSLDKEKLYSLEVSRYFSSDSGIRRYFDKVVSDVACSMNFTYHNDPYVGDIYEFDPFMYFAWHLFTLSDVIRCHLALGEGLSYLSKIPTRERRDSTDPKRLLNYLMFELVLGFPRHPAIELIGRIHHRSGVFGLYNANNSGSTAVGLAVRYFFL